MQGLLALLSRLQDPKDVQAAAIVAFAILVFEAGICPLIIAKIPCKFLGIARMSVISAMRYGRALSPRITRESTITLAVCSADTELDWVAYMQEVEGFMKVSPFSPTQLCKASATASSAISFPASNCGSRTCAWKAHLPWMLSDTCIASCGLWAHRVSSVPAHAGRAGLQRTERADRSSGVPCRLRVHLRLPAQTHGGRGRCRGAGGLHGHLYSDAGCGALAVCESAGAAACHPDARATTCCCAADCRFRLLCKCPLHDP